MITVVNFTNSFLPMSFWRGIVWNSCETQQDVKINVKRRKVCARCNFFHQNSFNFPTRRFAEVFVLYEKY